MVRIFLIAGLFLSPAATAFTEEIRQIEAVIESTINTRVLWSNGDPACRESIYGFYNFKNDVVVMCQENHKRNYAELVGTLKHEGWHAVQVKCNASRAALTDEQIRPHLQDRDRTNLHGYHPRQTRAEAEARVIEQIPTPAWIKGVLSYCSR
jgi:hypothetical protein